MNDEVRDILYVAQSATAENFKQYAGFADMGGMPVTVEVVGTIKWFDVTKGFGMEGIPCKQSHSFTIFDMIRGQSTTFIFIIHAGKVIVDERIGVDHFNCGR